MKRVWQDPQFAEVASLSQVANLDTGAQSDGIVLEASPVSAIG